MEASKVFDPKIPMHLQHKKFLIKPKTSALYLRSDALVSGKVTLWEKIPDIYNTDQPELKWDIYHLDDDKDLMRVVVSQTHKLYYATSPSFITEEIGFERTNKDITPGPE